MGIKKKVDSENIKNEKIKAVNKSENSAREIKSCDVDDTTISERLLSQPNIHKTNYQANIARLVFQFTLDSFKAAEQELPRSDLYSTTEIYENAQKWLVCNSEKIGDEVLSASQTKSIGEIMRVFNLDLSKTNDLSETLYVKKFRMNGNRKKLRRKNRKFRLFRGRYNRSEKIYEQYRIRNKQREIKLRNLFQVINQHAISLLNFHIGVFLLELVEFSKFDDAVLCKERLYLLTKEFRRILHSVEFKNENMLSQLLDYLKKMKNTNKSLLALIKGFLKLKYSLTCKILNEIEKRNLHSKIYNARKNKLVSISDFSRLHDEAVFCYIQDRNAFWGDDGMCQQCKQSRKTLDHLANRSKKMLGHDYTRRYNEVYDLLANDFILILCVQDGEYSLYYLKRLQILINVGAYIQFIVIKKTAETIYFDRRRGLDVISGAEMHKQPSFPLKEVDNEVFCEPTTNTNVGLELEEEIKVVKMLE
ncbi:hypothetical protein CWI38_0344p0030 [Hamiltosporidium tvaerminnensis]|uniref:Uncharacterized protein n=1 Tax=Hamiltosporidium tvaerminnensis TaxID=1176355 RepID=A0A4Q9LY58_9MICR|nr:hypothetical protein CWI38_0344p0030 [Hamiltosporidium tvaerminnensis]